MKKKLIIATTIFIVASMFTTNVNAAQVSNTKKGITKELNEFRKKFPELDEQLNDLDGKLELVEQKAVYYEIKYDKDDIKEVKKNKSSKSLEAKSVTQITKEEYKKAKAKELINNPLRENIISQFSLDYESNPELGYWVDGTDETEHIQLILEAYRLNFDNYGRFFVNVNWNWNRLPYMSSHDAFGINLSGMKVLYENSVPDQQTPIRYGANAILPVPGTDGPNDVDYEYPETVRRLVKSGDSGGPGVGVETNCLPGLQNTGYINAFVTMNDVTPGQHRFGTIGAYYISTATKGSLSISADGMPSIGFEATNNRFTTAVTVNNFK